MHGSIRFFCDKAPDSIQGQQILNVFELFSNVLGTDYELFAYILWSPDEDDDFINVSYNNTSMGKERFLNERIVPLIKGKDGDLSAPIISATCKCKESQIYSDIRVQIRFPVYSMPFTICADFEEDIVNKVKYKEYIKLICGLQKMGYSINNGLYHVYCMKNEAETLDGGQIGSITTSTPKLTSTISRADNHMERNNVPSWYWNKGLHDATILNIAVVNIQYDFTQKNPIRNYYSIKLDSSNALFDTSIEELQLIYYDAAGNPTSIGTNALTWRGRELTGYSAYTGFDLSYAYNADGIRTEKTYTTGGTSLRHEYTLSGTEILKETVYSGNTERYTLIYIYDENGSPIGYRYRTPAMGDGVFEGYFFEKNLQGDVIAVYNQSGTKLVSYVYDAWGSHTVTYLNGGVNTPAQYNPFRYRGYYYDTETGFYYLQSRYYNPAWGRFINADRYVATGLGLLNNNMFVYCFNNPINLLDILGYCPHQLVGDCNSCALSILSGDELQMLPPCSQTTSAFDIENDTFIPSTAVDVGLILYQALITKVLINSVGPKNIGVGQYSKLIVQTTGELNDLCSALSVVSTVIFIGVDIGLGIDNNLKNNASFGKIAYDAGVDLVISGGTSAVSIGLGTVLGTSICPGVGTAVGFVISFASFLIFDLGGLRDNLKGLVQ